jgi:hypothetical protein
MLKVRKNMKKIAGIFIVFLFISCVINVEVEFDQETFNKQRQLWQASNVKDYKYRLHAIGFSGYNGTIIVENGKNKENIPADGHFEGYSTIDEIYKTIGDSFKENNKKQPMNDVYLSGISVKYDKVNHIPIEIHYEYHIPAFSAVEIDGTFDYYISNFEKR